MARKQLRHNRPCAPWGALVPAIIGGATSLYSSIAGNKQNEAAMRRQLKLQEQQQNQERLATQANGLNQYLGTLNERDDSYYAYAAGGKVNKGRLQVEAGGVGTPIDENTILLRGRTHQEPNEAGGTGIYMNNGSIPFEAEDGEAVEQTPTDTRIFSNSLVMPNGLTPSENIQAGGDKDATFAWQQSFKDYYGLGDNGKLKTNNMYANRRRKLRNMGYITSPVEGNIGNRPKAPLGAKFGALDYASLGVNLALPFFAKSTSTGSYKRQRELWDRAYNMAMRPYIGSSYVSGRTDFRNLAEHAYTANQENQALIQNQRNTASSNVAAQRAQELRTNAALEQNKIFDKDAQANLQASMNDLEQRNRFYMGESQNRANYNAEAMRNGIALLSDRLDMERNRYDNTKLIQGLGDAVGNFFQQGIDNYNTDMTRRMYLAMSEGATADKMYNLGLISKAEYDKVRGIPESDSSNLRRINNNVVNRTPRFNNISSTNSVQNVFGSPSDKFALSDGRAMIRHNFRLKNPITNLDSVYGSPSDPFITPTLNYDVIPQSVLENMPSSSDALRRYNTSIGMANNINTRPVRRRLRNAPSPFSFTIDKYNNYIYR